MHFTLKIGYIFGNWKHTWGSALHGIEVYIGIIIV